MIFNCEVPEPVYRLALHVEGRLWAAGYHRAVVELTRDEACQYSMIVRFNDINYATSIHISKRALAIRNAWEPIVFDIVKEVDVLYASRSSN